MNYAKRPERRGLYDPQFEHDSCGVGFIAQCKGRASRKIVEDAEEILLRMTHRGAVGAEKNTGDGGGILTAIPDAFLRRVLGATSGDSDVKGGGSASSAGGSVDLPPAGSYGAGIVFLPQEAGLQEACVSRIEDIIAEEGLRLIAWRDLPRDNSMIGPRSRACEPAMKMLIVEEAVSATDTSASTTSDSPSANTSDSGINELERSLFVARKRITHSLRGKAGYDPDDFLYVASLSSRIIVYKGMLSPEQLFAYFDDLRAADFESHIAMVHSRFSTNTFPSWDRAQPLRFMSHNGEINTLRGNINKINSREGTFECAEFGERLKRSFPVSEPDLSDSGYFDNMLEFLVLTGKAIPEAIMMMIPEAWQRDANMSAEKRAMYEYYSTVMEPWDGPASIAFTDGKYIGATLDRNGLRPSRYYVTKDDVIVMASEVGVLDIPDSDVRIKGRLQPGRMFLVNFAEGRIISDAELKERYSSRFPYGDWLARQRIRLADLPGDASAGENDGQSAALGLDDSTLLLRLKMHGYTTEHLNEIIKPMAELGKEPLGSMGNDTPLAVLSDQPRLLYDYFKQLFAQVTNPPIDSVRESVIMSLKSYIGPEKNLLELGEEHAHRLLLEEPVITNEELARLKRLDFRGWKSLTVDTTYPVRSGEKGLREALDRVCTEVEAAIAEGLSVALLSDRDAGRGRIALPALLVVGAVHQHLVRGHLRTQIALVLESGEPREVHHFCTLLGFGADAVNPYLAFEVMWKMQNDGLLDTSLTRSKICDDYLRSIEYGMQKVFGKMGISTLESYKGAQIFEALGLAQAVVDRCFSGTTSRIEGLGFAEIAEECQRRHSRAFPLGNPAVGEELVNPGDYAHRHGGEGHLWSPESIALLQMATRSNNYALFKQFSAEQDQRSQSQFTLRGLFKFKAPPEAEIPLSEVEPASEITKRFATGAMSFGSISQEAHETLAIAMNRIGGKSNTGEGGEMPVRFRPLPNGDSKRSAIKQVASGRFGVTNEYLANADEIQIKMAQGAKPGEGGELPGHKVFEVIARTRHTTPGVGLISPPPHHDIYSIEDLAQLIFDLKNSNPQARISVKLVSEAGVGTIAAGVAKGHADHILISGHDGGTGASPLTGIKHAGLPWELGIAETHQTLVMNDLRSRVVIQSDGQLKTGRDVVIAAILGAEEYGFATSALITMGCIMMRKCHLNTCPVGIATQNEDLRKKFAGRPEDVVNFMNFIAEEVREHMARLGVRSINELVGRVDLLDTDAAVLNAKSTGLDLSPILHPADSEQAPSGVVCCTTQDHGIESVLDRQIIRDAAGVIYGGGAAQNGGEPESAPNGQVPSIRLEYVVKNTNRALGTMLSYEIAKEHGFAGLPPDSIHIALRGHAGQTFGGWLARGVTLDLTGDANDYVGKGLSGGSIIIRPASDAAFVPEENIIIGNVAFYGAISGTAFIRGMAAERFCVRNSGAVVVIEGVGDHGCEYMTGGRVVILGETGRNFAAGMSGGIAYIYDKAGNFEAKLNKGLVSLYSMADVQAQEQEYLRERIHQHATITGSTRAKEILANWETELGKFVKVISPMYQRILKLEEAKGGAEREGAAQEKVQEREGARTEAGAKGA